MEGGSGSRCSESPAVRSTNTWGNTSFHSAILGIWPSRSRLSSRCLQIIHFHIVFLAPEAHEIGQELPVAFPSPDAAGSESSPSMHSRSLCRFRWRFPRPRHRVCFCLLASTVSAGKLCVTSQQTQGPRCSVPQPLRKRGPRALASCRTRKHQKSSHASKRSPATPSQKWGFGPRGHIPS